MATSDVQIEVYVKLPSGKATAFLHSQYDTVRDIAKKVADEEKVKENRVRLKYQGKILNKHTTIARYGIRAETILKGEVLFPKDITVRLKLPDGATDDIVLQTTDTVEALKNAVFNRTDISCTEQNLKVGKACIHGDNSSLLCEVGIDDQTVVMVDKKPKQSPMPSSNGDSVFTEEANEEIKDELLSTFDSGGRNVEVVFCFDTTGSMYSVIQKVRSKLRDTCTRLLQDISNIRIGLMANGDYSDSKVYVVKHEDLTRDVDVLERFVMHVNATGGGGNGGEAYEWALRKAQGLDWSEDSAKAFVMIGDEPPHHKYYTDQRLDWREEVDVLSGMGIKVYGVQALDRRYEKAFYQEIAHRSDGFYLQLKDFDLITDMFLAVCYREAADGQLEDFVQEVEQQGRMTENTQQILDTLQEQSDEQTDGHKKERPRPCHDSELDRLPWWNPGVLSSDDHRAVVEISAEYLYQPDKDNWVHRDDRSDTNAGHSLCIESVSLQQKKSKWKRFLGLFKTKSCQ